MTPRTRMRRKGKASGPYLKLAPGEALGADPIQKSSQAIKDQQYEVGKALAKEIFGKHLSLIHI